MSDTAIRVENLSKLYRISTGRAPYKTLRESLSSAITAPLRRWRDRRPKTADGSLGPPSPVPGLRSPVPSPPQPGPPSPVSRPSPDNHIWALNDVSFEVKHGEVLGIIGRNGAGKSTLLKILSRITKPTQGRAEIHGRIASLLEVGTGFHPELTGRENTYLNGAILGMKKAELERKFDEIVAFAEVEKFIDTPVKHYSSGMYVRLAFAVAAHLQAEILLVDEVLAVGDVAFQKKCLGKMGKVARQGRTVLLVSHNMAAIAALCGKALLLNEGRFVLQDIPETVIAQYLHSAVARAERQWDRDENGSGDETIRLLAVRILDPQGRPTDQIPMSSGFEVQMEYEIHRRTVGIQVGFRLLTADGTVVLTSGDTDMLGVAQPERLPGRYTSRCSVPAYLLSPRTYFLSFGAHVPNIQVHFFLEAALIFAVLRTESLGGVGDDHRLGVISPILPWTISKIGEA